ncbi:hypothetical protein Plhal304r1_c057g0143161 [Plasmopara halstedii]
MVLKYVGLRECVHVWVILGSHVAKHFTARHLDKQNVEIKDQFLMGYWRVVSQVDQRPRQ